MNPTAVEAWAWILLYSGGLTLVLGLFTHDADPALGLILILAGLLGIVAGVGLIVWRSFMVAAPGDDKPTNSR